MGIQARIAERLADRLPGDHRLTVDQFISAACYRPLGVAGFMSGWRDQVADEDATAEWLSLAGTPVRRLRMLVSMEEEVEQEREFAATFR